MSKQVATDESDDDLDLESDEEFLNRVMLDLELGGDEPAVELCYLLDVSFAECKEFTSRILKCEASSDIRKASEREYGNISLYSYTAS